jgi:hypothetical protein
VFVAIAAAAVRQMGASTAARLGLSAGLGVVVAFAVVALLTVWQRRRWETGKPAGYALAPVAANHALLGLTVPAAPPRVARMDAWINQLTSRDFSVFVVAAAALGHLDWILWMAAVGTHVFWLSFLGVQLYVFRLDSAEAA